MIGRSGEMPYYDWRELKGSAKTEQESLSHETVLANYVVIPRNQPSDGDCLVAQFRL